MNTIYKITFNRSRGMLVVASELAKTAVKSGTKLVAATVVGAALSVGGGGRGLRANSNDRIFY